MSIAQRVRAFLFYLSLSIFLIGLPFILSFALGYKFDPRTFKFTKTGLMVLKTQPQGASIYLDGKLFNEKTPTSINELLPARYNVRLELERHYPWVDSVNVERGKITRLDKIILFPLRSNIKHLNKYKISSFWVDEERERIYYINQEENIIYRSDLEGQSFKEIGILPKVSSLPKKYKISPDKERLLIFNQHQIAAAYLEPRNTTASTQAPFVLNYSDRKVCDVFWHSDSYHLIVITNKNIEVLEAKPHTEPVNLVNLNKKNIVAFYDDAKDTLYFMDSQKAADGKFYDNVYELELSSKSYSFQELIKSQDQ